MSALPENCPVCSASVTFQGKGSGHGTVYFACGAWMDLGPDGEVHVLVGCPEPLLKALERESRCPS